MKFKKIAIVLLNIIFVLFIVYNISLFDNSITVKCFDESGNIVNVEMIYLDVNSTKYTGSNIIGAGYKTKYYDEDSVQIEYGDYLIKQDNEIVSRSQVDYILEESDKYYSIIGDEQSFVLVLHNNVFTTSPSVEEVYSVGSSSSVYELNTEQYYDLQDKKQCAVNCQIGGYFLIEQSSIEFIDENNFIGYVRGVE